MLWDVWEVIPNLTERRSHRVIVPVDRRRSTPQSLPALPFILRRGWLAFQSKSERRRLAPVPERWVDKTDEQLAELVRFATPRPGRPRRLIE